MSLKFGKTIRTLRLSQNYFVLIKKSVERLGFKDYHLKIIHEWIFFFLQYVSLMIPLIYYKLKYIFGMFYNKLYCIF